MLLGESISIVLFIDPLNHSEITVHEFTRDCRAGMAALIRALPLFMCVGVRRLADVSGSLDRRESATRADSLSTYPVTLHA